MRRPPRKETRFRVRGTPRGGVGVLLDKEDLVDAFERLAQARLLGWTLEGGALTVDVAAAGEPRVWEGITFVWAAKSFDWDVVPCGPDRPPGAG